jgi:protein-disulfide isomerase-like protein with CxxC motif
MSAKLEFEGDLRFEVDDPYCTWSFGVGETPDVTGAIAEHLGVTLSERAAEGVRSGKRTFGRVRVTVEWLS